MSMCNTRYLIQLEKNLCYNIALKLKLWYNYDNKRKEYMGRFCVTY